ncbi:aminotransferase class III-fold pyridoxal phosphate-dependent enzyme [Kordia sp. YSTF-M3]|uniref:Aminotransferase class III-fold pyridoxal phosphate-dependent enzyme n=1 Tax=Kordia aestuariivivens TaxID=2759037 RepID=A0ABR7QCJ9_9FLAO|nr:aminotransferase class III-fold pyridoxal phosphate-dependent enzyme [Kordia aestuariivivens]MBC8756297.1 aminotransferase class III-fold pyridoxal phosphate-dependent enzyme [Kordia aestuariivivens]
MIEPKMNITNAYEDYLIDTSEQEYFDLCMGYGSVCLGHNFPPVVSAQVKQLKAYTSPGFIESSVYVQAKEAVEKYVEGYNVHGFYPSGANAVEIAVKMAMASNGKSKIISFANSMHGKTIFANKLGFESCLKDDNQIIRIPFVGEKEESEILEICENHMREGTISAVIIEPIQMSGGGFKASSNFYQSLQDLASRFGVLQIYDEILIGFHRTGSSFFFKTHNLKPDIVLGGKAMGSGFPIAVVLQEKTFITPEKFRGGGTYFNHPMACASVIATLKAYEQLDVETYITEIEKCVLEHLPAASLAGQGALWNINLGSQSNTKAVVKELMANKIIVSFYDQYIRFFPSFLVDLSKLTEACKIVKKFL